jgi:tRNA(Ile)-lysidine synthase
MAEPRRLTELARAVAEAADLPAGPKMVALSGGADSAALLWVCRRLEVDPLRAVHVHHGLAASDALAASARSVAEHLGVECRVIDVTVPPGSSPENQAREVRYAALESATEAGEWVLTAHTLDDQAETVLDHLLRALGPDGLAGIPARRPPFARPFLAVTRSQTREMATLAGLPWMDDPVNASPDPLRNRIRRRLIPDLEASYNPRLRRSLATTARLVAADVDYLEARLHAPIEVGERWAAVAASVLTTAAPSAASRLVRRLLASAGLESASPEAVEGLLAVARGDRAGHQPGNGLEARRRGAMLVVEWGEAAIPAPATLRVGRTRFGGWVFDAHVADTPPPAMPLGASWMVADADTVGDLRVESAHLHPDLSPHLAAAGVAAPDRLIHPVVVGEDGPVWVPYVRRLGSGWVDGATGRYLVVRTRSKRKWQR